ncbi:MAG TPA: type III pantothenate kinase [Candidatus Omnitrophota bacterium]|nr:type III pantothenate kinase [Candidatus Omnitrophota bacterium]HPS36951.1 type III pantothenate kinase [Candidatus Omnitrophota bacterium]
MIKRVLAIDIGNTAATVGFYEAGRLLDFGSVYYNDIPKYVNKCIKSGRNCHFDIVISSVIPKITDFLICNLQNIKRITVWVAGENLPIKIKHKYIKYNELGCDRKVNIYGAAKIYRLPILIIDYGTAITFDYVNAKGVFKGGMIIPGPETAFRALGQRAALLPKELPLPKKVKSFLGRTTKECMETGILEGYGAMTDELIRRFRQRFGKKLRVLATGGFAGIIRPYTRNIDTVDPKHSVKSLLALWRERAGK